MLTLKKQKQNSVKFSLLPGNDPMKPFWDYTVPDHRPELGLCEPGESVMLSL